MVEEASRDLDTAEFREIPDAIVGGVCGFRGAALRGEGGAEDGRVDDAAEDGGVAVVAGWVGGGEGGGRDAATELIGDGGPVAGDVGREDEGHCDVGRGVAGKEGGR